MELAPAPSFSVNGTKGVAAVPWVVLPAVFAAPPNANPEPALAVLLAPKPVFVVAAPPPKGLLAAGAAVPPNGLFCVVLLVAPKPPPALDEPKRPPPVVAAAGLPKPPVAGLL